MKYTHIFSSITVLTWFFLGIAIPTHAVAHQPSTPKSFQWQTKATKAIDVWRKKAGLHPQADQPKVYLGEALMQRARETGDVDGYTDAKAAFAAALKLNSNNSAAMAGMAWAHGALHEFDASIRWAEKAIALDPQNTDGYGLLGDAAVELGDYDSAFDYYQKMIDIRPDLASYSRGAHLLFVTGDIHSAIALMEKAVVAGGPFAENTAWCRAALARMLLSIGASSQAEKVLRTGLEEAPDNIHLLAVQGMVRASRTDYQ